MKELLTKLLENTFIPIIDMPTKLPDTAGAYLICAKNTDALPARMKELEYSYVNGLPVIYVGIAGRTTSKVKSIRLIIEITLMEKLEALHYGKAWGCCLVLKKNMRVKQII